MITAADIDAMRDEGHENDALILKYLQDLLDNGYILAERDLNINSAFPGRYQITESYETGTESCDARYGPQAVVGDDLKALIRESHACFVGI